MKGFTRRTDLKKHAYFHTGVKPFKCSICSKTFSRNTNLTKHMKTHSNSSAIKSHSCDKCPKNFATHIELLRHQKTHEKTNDVLGNQQVVHAQSPQIIKTFHRTDYNSHPQQQPIPVQMPPSSQQNSCMKCNLSFNKFEDLNAHMIIVHNLHHFQQQQQQLNQQHHPHVVLPPNEYQKPFTGLGFYSEQDFK